MLEQLKSIWVEAYLPVRKTIFYANDQRVVNISDGKKQFEDQKITNELAESLRTGFNNKINKLYTEFQNKEVSEACIAIAKDSSNKIIAFILMEKVPLKNHIDSKLISLIDGSRNVIDIMKPANDEVYISLLAVIPSEQKKGIGKN